jgi:hypothetical protein
VAVGGFGDINRGAIEQKLFRGRTVAVGGLGDFNRGVNEHLCLGQGSGSCSSWELWQKANKHQGLGAGKWPLKGL